MGKFCQFFKDLSACNTSVFSFLDNNLSKKKNGFSPNMVCTSILWRYGLGLYMGKFCLFLTVLSPHHTIMPGYYGLNF